MTTPELPVCMPREGEAGPSKWARRVSEDAGSGYVDLEGNVLICEGMSGGLENKQDQEVADEAARIDSKLASSCVSEYDMKTSAQVTESTSAKSESVKCASCSTDKTANDIDACGQHRIEDLRMRICLPAHVPPPPTPELEAHNDHSGLKPLTPISLPGAFPIDGEEVESAGRKGSVLGPVDSRRESDVVSWLKDGIVGKSAGGTRSLPDTICPLTEAARASLER